MKELKMLTAKEWGESFLPPISSRTVSRLFIAKRIVGAVKKGGDIEIPEGTPDPRLPKGWQKGRKRK
jgi:hypothetical protein